MESEVVYIPNKDIVEAAYSGEPIQGYLGNPVEMLAFLVLRYGNYVSIELGPGKKKQRPAGIGLNNMSDPTADILFDLNGGLWIFPNESIDEIYSNQFLEHLEKKNQIGFFNSMWAVLKPGGKMEHIVPHFLSPHSVSDPTHFTQYSEESFKYYGLDSDGEPFVESFSDYGITCRFEIVEMVVRPRLDIRVVMRKPGRNE